MNIDALKAAVRNASPEGYTPQCHWLYHDAAGADVMAVARFNVVEANGKERPKQFRPFVSNGNGGFVSTFPERRPLYNLHKLAANPEAVVLVVEGEKAADAAAKLFPDYVHHLGGRQSSRVKDGLAAARRAARLRVAGQ